jgi:Glycosyltransferase family 87
VADARGPAARLVALLAAEMPRPVFLPALLAAIALPLAYHVATWGDLQTFTVAIDHCAVPMCDFVRHYDPMGRAVFSHHGPVPGFLYPPGFAVALGLLGRVSPGTALYAWAALQVLAIAALAGCGWVLLERGRRPVFLVYVVLLLSSYPVLHNLKWGQVSTPITVLVLTAVILVRRPSRRAQAAAGLLLAGAVAVKFYPAAFAPAVIGRGRMRTGLWFVLGCVLFLAVVPAVALGPGEAVDFYRAIFRRYSPKFLLNINSQSLAAVTDRWLRAAGDPSMVELVLPAPLQPVAVSLARHAGAVRGVVEVVGAGIVALNAALAWALWRGRAPRAEGWLFVLIAATLPFVLPTSWPHYFAHLPFCQAFVVHRLLTDAGPPRRALAVAALLVLPSALLSGAVAFNAVGNWLMFNFVGFVFGSNLLLLAAVYAALPRTAWTAPWRRVTGSGPPAAVSPGSPPAGPAGSPSAPG